MVNPVPGRSVTTPFGKKGSWAAGYHTGDDYAAPMGTKVVASRAGKVLKVGYNGDYGNQVVIESGGVRHSYNHLSAFSVKVGQQVAEGQEVGKVGSTGNSTGPHLHYEERTAPFAYANHRKPQFNSGGSSSTSSSSPSPVTTQIYTDRLGFGQRDSDTVKELQRLLNGTKLVGGKNLPITGNYLDMTDAEVRKWQEQVCGDKPDPAGRSYLGPRQRARMFPSPPYTIHDKGLPAAARPAASGGDGAGSGPDVGGGGDRPVPAWFVAPSLAALKDEVDARWPDRDRSSDGTIGDYAHSQSKSEHNPVGHRFGPEFGTAGAVHAMDITVAGTDKQVILDALIGDRRVWYVIHSGFIWSKTYKWEKRAYNGSDPHIKHIHVSLAADDQTSALRNEKDIEPWLAVEEPEPPVTVPPGKPDPEITVPPGKPDLSSVEWLPIAIVAAALIIAAAILAVGFSR